MFYSHLLLVRGCGQLVCFFFNDTATTEIYTLSLHDALPIRRGDERRLRPVAGRSAHARALARSEEHTSELQSRGPLVCRLLLEKKKPADGQTLAPGHGSSMAARLGTAPT